MNIQLVTKGAMSLRDRQRVYRRTEQIRNKHQRSMRANLRSVFRTQEEAIMSLEEPTLDDVYNILVRSVPLFTRVYETSYVSIAEDVYPLSLIHI